MGVYRPRNPRASALWQCARRHAAQLRESGRIRRPVEQQVIERFIECGDPHHGFARIYCDACGHDWMLAFSCKTRYFCPSCHQKRVLLYGEWVEEQVLAPVAHRQYVFTIPRLLRPMFGVHRAWLGELCRIAARLLVEAYAEAAPGARPGPASSGPRLALEGDHSPHVSPAARHRVARCEGQARPRLPPTFACPHLC
jgi:Transposase zinc-binding domain